jgi:hypothetical protein
MVRQRIGVYVIGVSMIAIVVGSFLPWLQFGRSVRGWDYMDGPVVSGAAWISLWVVLLESRRRDLGIKWVPVGVLGVPMWAVWAAWVLIVYIASSRFLEIENFPGLNHVGYGLWGVLIGLLTAGIGFVMLGRGDQ